MKETISGCEELFTLELPSYLKKVYEKAKKIRLADIKFPATYSLRLSFSPHQYILRPIFIFLEIREMYNDSYTIHFNKGFLSALNDMSLSSAQVYLDYLEEEKILKKWLRRRASIYKISDINPLEKKLDELEEIVSVVWKNRTKTICKRIRKFISKRYSQLKKMVDKYDVLDEGKSAILLYIPTKEVKKIRRRLRE